MSEKSRQLLRRDQKGIEALNEPWIFPPKWVHGRTECRYELPLPIAEDRDGILVDIRKRSPRNCAPSVARVRGGHKRKEIEHLTLSEALAERLTQGIVSAATLRGMANRKRASSGRQLLGGGLVVKRVRRTSLRALLSHSLSSRHRFGFGECGSKQIQRRES